MRLEKGLGQTNDCGGTSVVGVLKQLFENASTSGIVTAYFPQGHSQPLVLWVLLSRLRNHDDEGSLRQRGCLADQDNRKQLPLVEQHLEGVGFGCEDKAV